MDKKISKVCRDIMFAGVAACVYQIWRSRNEAVWNHKVWSAEHSIQNIKKDVYNRLHISLSKKITKKDRE